MSKQQEDAEDKPVDRSRERREDMGDELTASDDEDIGPKRLNTTRLGNTVQRLHRGGIFLSAAVTVLSEEVRLMTTGEITQIAIERGHLHTNAKTPAQSMASALFKDVRIKGDKSAFIKPEEGKFGLREWLDRPDLDIPGLEAMNQQEEEAPAMGNLAAAAAASAGRGKQGLDMLGAIAMDLSEHPSPKKRPASSRGRRRSAPGTGDGDGGRRTASKSNLANSGDPEISATGRPRRSVKRRSYTFDTESEEEEAEPEPEPEEEEEEEEHGRGRGRGGSAAVPRRMRTGYKGGMAGPPHGYSPMPHPMFHPMMHPAAFPDPSAFMMGPGMDELDAKSKEEWAAAYRSMAMQFYGADPSMHGSHLKRSRSQQALMEEITAGMMAGGPSGGSKASRREGGSGKDGSSGKAPRGMGMMPGAEMFMGMGMGQMPPMMGMMGMSAMAAAANGEGGGMDPMAAMASMMPFGGFPPMMMGPGAQQAILPELNQLPMMYPGAGAMAGMAGMAYPGMGYPGMGYPGMMGMMGVPKSSRQMAAAAAEPEPEDSEEEEVEYDSEEEAKRRKRRKRSARKEGRQPAAGAKSAGAGSDGGTSQGATAAGSTGTMPKSEQGQGQNGAVSGQHGSGVPAQVQQQAQQRAAAAGATQAQQQLSKQQLLMEVAQQAALRQQQQMQQQAQQQQQQQQAKQGQPGTSQQAPPQQQQQQRPPQGMAPLRPGSHPGVPPSIHQAAAQQAQQAAASLQPHKPAGVAPLPQPPQHQQQKPGSKGDTATAYDNIEKALGLDMGNVGQLGMPSGAGMAHMAGLGGAGINPLAYAGGLFGSGTKGLVAGEDVDMVLGLPEVAGSELEKQQEAALQLAITQQLAQHRASSGGQAPGAPVPGAAPAAARVSGGGAPVAAAPSPAMPAAGSVAQVPGGVAAHQASSAAAQQSELQMMVQQLVAETGASVQEEHLQQLVQQLVEMPGAQGDNLQQMVQQLVDSIPLQQGGS